MIAYQAPMLSFVDYNKFDEDFGFSLVDLEHGTLESCCDFLKALKHALMDENLIQVPELLTAHLCAYLGTVVTIHTVHGGEKLEEPVIAIIKHQAHAAYEGFNNYPINSTVKSDEQKKENVELLRKKSPGSIVVQTIRLGRVMMDILDELKHPRQGYSNGSRFPKQAGLCSNDTLTKLMLLVGSEKCAEWRGELDDLSDHYVINQLAIQIGWLIGYFSHLDNKSPDKTDYFDYGLPMFTLYREHIYKLMHAYAGAVNAQA